MEERREKKSRDKKKKRERERNTLSIICGMKNDEIMYPELQ